MNKDRAEQDSSTGVEEVAPAPPPPGASSSNKSWKPETDKSDAPLGGGKADAAESTSVISEPDPPSIEPRTQPAAERPAFPAVGGASGDSGAAGATAAAGLRPSATTAGEPKNPVSKPVVDEDEYDDDFDDDEEYGGRKIRLSIARIDTWSTLKLSFLLSVAIGIGIIVASACIWLMLDGMAVFTKIDDLLQSVAGDEAQIEILQFFEFNKIISLATIIAVVDVIVITLIATLGSVIYNIVSSLIGGLKITLTDE